MQHDIDFARPHNPSLTSRYLHQSAAHQICNTPKRERSQASGALAAAAAMRITPDLHRRSSKKITPHIPPIFFGPPFSNFPPYFFKVADLRFNTFLDTNGTLRHRWRSPRALEMLPMDSPLNFTLDGMFAPHFRKRSLAKIEKFNKKN